MTKIRITIFLITSIIVVSASYIFSLYARGYRYSPERRKLLPSGLLIIKSNPDGAQVNINGEQKTITNNNLALAPGTYDINIKKEGSHTWKKRITIDKEEVTEIDAFLFKTAPSLSAITFTSVAKPSLSPDSTKIAYIVPSTQENLNEDKEGLWLIETVDLPLGFSREPKRLTNGDHDESVWKWSPNSREILLQTNTGVYLLNTGSYTPQEDRINISSQYDEIIKEWEKERENRFKSKLRGLPEEIVEVLESAQKVSFSPDETQILYLAGSNYDLPKEIIKPIPGASSQKQERNVQTNKVYVYYLKEDRNFFLSDSNESLKDCIIDTPSIQTSCSSSISWFPTSRHILLAESDNVIVMDSDGTNRIKIYTGSYVAPNAFATVSKNRLIILTNLGANSAAPNLYTLGIK